MKLDKRYPEAQFGRFAPTQFPRLRCRDICCLRTNFKEEILQPIRRKPSTTLVRHSAQSGKARDLEVARTDHKYNESTFPFRHRTDSLSSIYTIHLRSTATKPKNDSGAVATQKTASRKCSATSSKQGSKQKSSFQPITTQSKSTSSLSLSTSNAKAPRKKRSKKSGNGPEPKPLPTIFNVGQTSSLSGLVALPSTAISTTTTTTTTTTNSLDDPFFWNMDKLSSIPNISPVTQSTTTASPSTSYSAPSDAPFSTPYDEDALFENEIPFPFNKHSGVIIENMGVKKAKNLNKGKGSLLKRHITTTGSPNSDPTTLPLSLRPLSQNTIDLDLLQADIPRKTTPIIPVAAPFSSFKDAWRRIHVGPSDCELSIAFPQTSHFEVWDMDDEAFFACPLYLCLMMKDPRRWIGTPIALPDFNLIDIRCDDLPVPSSMSVYDPDIEYAVQCSVPWNRSLPPPPYYSSSSKEAEFPFIVDHNEITIEGKWEKTYTKPKMEGQALIFDADPGKKGDLDVDGTRNARGWYLKIWIPIPARLFMKRETRIFEIRASVWMMTRQVSNMMDLKKEEEEEEEDSPLIFEAEMTVSHLRSAREMMM